MYSDYFTLGDGGGLTNPYSAAPADLAVERGGRSTLAPRLAALGMLGLTAGLAGLSASHPPAPSAARHLHLVGEAAPAWPGDVATDR